MKIVHLGDLHIGKTVNEFSMIDDQRYILEQIIEIIKEQKADAVLIAGDVYDKAIPGEEAVRLLDWFLCSLAQTGAETYLISGNHDSDERLNFGSSLFLANKIYIAAKYSGKLYKKICQDEYGPVNIYLLPFVKASLVRHFHPDFEIASYDDAVRVVLSQADINPQERNILAAHQFVAGKSGDPKPGGSESAAVLNVGTVEKIGADCFDDFDYTALGHIHSPQRAGRETVRYCGSPLKYSAGEVNDEKSVPVITIGKKGEVKVELLPLKPLRDMRHLKGNLRQLLDRAHIAYPNDYIYVTLTDESPVNDVMQIFRQYYPNTMQIMYDNAHTRGVQDTDFTKTAEKKSFSELISEFYRIMYGCEISGSELKIMKEAAEEAGIIYETNEIDH